MNWVYKIPVIRYNSPMNTPTISKNRYNLIDAVRAVAIISMVAYHLCYDIFMIYGVDSRFIYYPGVILWERSICSTFIFVSGISLNFSRHAVRRGIIVNLCGLAVSVVMLIFMPSQQIWFGVLNLIGCSMLITYALRKPLGHIPPLAGMLLSFLLFSFLYSVPNGYVGFFKTKLTDLPGALYFTDVLAPLGLSSPSFRSSDYFPLIPWLFLFICGWFFWRFIRERGWDSPFRFNIPVLSFIGRYSLIIYLVHQPLLYALCALIFGHF